MEEGGGEERSSLSLFPLLLHSCFFLLSQFSLRTPAETLPWRATHALTLDCNAGFLS